MKSLHLTGLKSEKISELSGIEHCVNLEMLWVELRTWDIGAIGSLKELQSLWLSGPITDISPLSGLKKLQMLWLKQTQVSDISPLNELTNLQKLHLWSNRISDITPLSNLTNLRRLYISDNKIEDVTPLGNLTNLRELRLVRNRISDISSLTGLNNLQVLNLENNQIKDISSLANLKNLRVIYLCNNLIQDIFPLETLEKIGEDSPERMEQEGMWIYLDLRNNWISDISPLVNNPYIGKGDGINLRGNPLNEDAYDVHIPALRERGVGVIFDPKPSGKITLSPGDVNKVVTFADKNLEAEIRKALTISERPTYRGDAARLKGLMAPEKDINVLSGIEHCIGLGTLGLENNYGISDITPLANLNNLKWLNLKNNRISDISPLVNNLGIGEGDTVDLRGNPLNEEAYDVHIPELQRRGVNVLSKLKKMPETGGELKVIPNSITSEIHFIGPQEPKSQTPQRIERRFAVNLTASYTGEIPPISYSNLRVEKAITDAGEYLTPQPSVSYRTPEPGFFLKIHLNLTPPQKPCKKLVLLAGSVVLKFGLAAKGAEVKPVKQWVGKKIDVPELSDKEVYLEKLDRDYIEIRYSHDTWKALDEVKFFDSQGNMLRTIGSGGHIDREYWLEQYNLSIPEDGAIVFFFYEDVTERTFSFEIKDQPPP